MRDRSAMDIMLVEDHSMIREAHAQLLRQELPRATFVEFGSVAAAMAAPMTDRPLRLILLNHDLAGGQDLAGFRALRRRHGDVPVVLMDAPETPRRVMDALDAGTAGYIPKSMRGETILQALLLVMSGERYIPSFVLSGVGGRGVLPVCPAEGTSHASPTPITSLSPRRREILSMVAGGAPNKVIARALAVHEVTVKSHLRVIFKALGVTSRTQAARVAMVAGMADLGSSGGQASF